MKYRKIVLLLSFLMVAFVNTHAQIKDGVNSVLWQVKHPRSSHISYLLGTSHDFGAEWVESFGVIDSLLSASQTFICENTLDHDTAAVKNVAMGLAGEKRTAREFFGKDFDLVNTYFVKNNGESITAMDTSKMPKAFILHSYFSYLNNLLGEKSNLKVSKRGDMMESMDHVLKARARQRGKEMMVLDNPTHIKAVFTSEKFINAIVAAIVQYVEIINSIDTDGSKSSASLSWYESMKNYEHGECYYSFKDDYPDALGDEALKQRNDDWMKLLPTQIKTRDCFIAVGDQHLNYKKGLLRQLAKQGFILTPVKLKSRSAN